MWQIYFENNMIKSIWANLHCTISHFAFKFMGGGLACLFTQGNWKIWGNWTLPQDYREILPDKRGVSLNMNSYMYVNSLNIQEQPEIS